MLAVTGSCDSITREPTYCLIQQGRSLTGIGFSVPLYFGAELLLGEAVGLGDGVRREASAAAEAARLTGVAQRDGQSCRLSGPNSERGWGRRTKLPIP